jgi:hypothetical protein
MVRPPWQGHWVEVSAVFIGVAGAACALGFHAPRVAAAMLILLAAGAFGQVLWRALR